MESTALAVVRSSHLIDQSYVVIHLFDIGGNAVSNPGRSNGMHGNLSGRHGVIDLFYDYDFVWRVLIMPSETRLSTMSYDIIVG